MIENKTKKPIPINILIIIIIMNISNSFLTPKTCRASRVAGPRRASRGLVVSRVTTNDESAPAVSSAKEKIRACGALILHLRQNYACVASRYNRRGNKKKTRLQCGALNLRLRRAIADETFCACAALHKVREKTWIPPDAPKKGIRKTFSCRGEKESRLMLHEPDRGPKIFSRSG